MRSRQMALVVGVVLAMVRTGAAETAVLSGDKDGFGVGCPVAGNLHYLDYGEYYGDYRAAGDPTFTDAWLLGDRSWTHSYSLGGVTPVSATLELFVAGIANGAATSADIRFDGTKVGTMAGIDGGNDLTRLVTFDVPIALLTGTDVVLVDVSNAMDGWIIDYSRLMIAASDDSASQPVPVPGALALGVLGVLGVRGMRKHRLA